MAPTLRGQKVERQSVDSDAFRRVGLPITKWTNGIEPVVFLDTPAACGNLGFSDRAVAEIFEQTLLTERFDLYWTLCSSYEWETVTRQW